MVYRRHESTLYRLNTSRIFGQPEGRYLFLSVIRPLEPSLSRSCQSRIWVCQKADNPVTGFVETMKHRFIEFNQFTFHGGQKAGN
jgi:hypothetical protein